MKKIVLSTLNARYTHSSLALYYLRETLSPLALNVEVCEFSINQPHLEILSKLAQKEADVYALGVYIWNSELIKPLIEDLKEILPSALIVLGGPEVSYNYDKWLTESDSIDYIISGNGENGLYELLSARDLPAKKVIMPQPILLNEVPFPYRNFEPEDIRHRYIYYETSRGCPYSCAYCLSSRTDQKLDFRELELVYSELEFFIKHQYAHIKLVDRTFNADPKRARKIWRHILSLYRKYPEAKTSFHFEIHPQLIEMEDIDVLSEIPADRFRLEIGVQSLNPQVMKIINRKLNWQKVKNTLLALRNLTNIKTHLDLIAGLPTEDFDSFGRGFDELINIGTDHLQLGFLKVLPGTEMHETASSYRIIYENRAPYEVLQTAALTWKELTRVRMIEEITENYYNSGRFATLIRGLIDNQYSIWKIFNELAEYYILHDHDIQTKKWTNCGKIICDFLTEKHYLPAIEIKDRLRIDWCDQAKSHYYPPWLDSNILKLAKSHGYAELKRLQSEGNKLIPAHLARQAIFFAAESSLIPASDIWLFYGNPSKKQKIILHTLPA